MRYLFVIAALVLSQCARVQAEWHLKYEYLNRSGQDLLYYTVYSDEVEVRTVRDKIVKTYVRIFFLCSPDKPGESLSLVFSDVPRFSNKKVSDLGLGLSFGIMTSLHRKGKDEPTLGYPEVIQIKDTPKMVFFDIGFVQKMRRYDVLSIGFGWKQRGHVDGVGVTAHVSLEGSSALIKKAQRKCGSP